MRDARFSRSGRPARRSTAPGPLRLLAAAGLLAAVGFGAGVVAGVVLEDPGLLLAHLAGRSREVPVDVASGPPGSEAPGPGPRPDERHEPVAGPPAPERHARAAPAEPAAAPPAPATRVPPGLAIQVGAFADVGAAERLASRLRERGHPVYVAPGKPKGPWRVRVGPLASRPEAERLAVRLQREERLPTWIVREEAR